MSGTRSQGDRILWQLQAAFPSWVPALTLSRISLQYNARVFGLRRKGWQIESRVQVVIQTGAGWKFSEPASEGVSLTQS